MASFDEVVGYADGGESALVSLLHVWALGHEDLLPDYYDERNAFPEAHLTGRND